MFFPRVVSLSCLSLLLAAGTAHAQIQFADAANYATPTHPTGIVAADFNADGRIDLAVTTDAPDRVTILLNAGAGEFAAPIRHSIPNGHALGAIVAGDFDGNGTVDVAVVMKNSNLVAIMNNNGSGYFLLGSLLSVGALPVDIKAGDLDGDGNLDLLCANRDGDSVSIMHNSGGGSFTVQTIPVGQEPHALALGDLNGDGTLDIAVSLHGDRAIATLLNFSGTFSSPYSAATASNHRPEGVAIADVNHDGRNDVVYSTGDVIVATNFVGLFLGNGSGILSTSQLFPTGGSLSTHLVAGDFDGDGFADCAVTNEGESSLSVLAGSASGFSAPLMLVSGTHPDGIAAADFNADGRPDLACSNADSDTTSVFLSTFGRFCIADFNLDGVVDFNDYLDFMALFSVQAPDADVNHDSVVDGMDYLDFIAGFAAGC